MRKEIINLNKIKKEKDRKLNCNQYYLIMVLGIDIKYCSVRNIRSKLLSSKLKFLAETHTYHKIGILKDVIYKLLL